MKIKNTKMKTITVTVDSTKKSELDLEKVAGGKIKTLHAMSSFKQDDLTAVVTIAVTMATTPKTAKAEKN